MKIEQALNRIAELGQQMMLDPNPEVAHVGAAILALPITASEDCDDFNELVHMIFMFVKMKAEQKQAIQKLLDPNED
jgi:hypothetical protein